MQRSCQSNQYCIINMISSSRPMSFHWYMAQPAAKTAKKIERNYMAHIIVILFEVFIFLRTSIGRQQFPCLSDQCFILHVVYIQKWPAFLEQKEEREKNSYQWLMWSLSTESKCSNPTQSTVHQMQWTLASFIISLCKTFNENIANTKNGEHPIVSCTQFETELDPTLVWFTGRQATEFQMFFSLARTNPGITFTHKHVYIVSDS